MLASLVFRLSYANVIATLALFVALGGSSYAALNLPKGSVGPRQLEKNSVSSPKVKRGSLLVSDFRPPSVRASAVRSHAVQGVEIQRRRAGLLDRLHVVELGKPGRLVTRDVVVDELTQIQPLERAGNTQRFVLAAVELRPA